MFIKILPNMKKTVFLALTLIVLSAASVNAQVTIGSDQDPQSGSVLDLSKVNDQKLGLLLPRVWLENITEWQLRGSDPTNGVGMLVYNTNPGAIGGNGKAGVYIWTGSGWEPLKLNLSSAVQVTDFNLDPSSKNVDIYVGETVAFTASNFVPVNAAYPGVMWNITAGTDKASINKATKSMTGCTVTGLTAGTGTLTVTSLDENVRKTVTVNVKSCESAPAVPTGIIFSKTTGIKPDEEITATATPEITSGGAKPVKYKWTIPDVYFDIIAGAGTRVITLKAKAITASVTGEIKVNAENTCGTSADYINTTALSISNCTGAPATPDAITLLPTTVNINSTFTASVTAVMGATSYTWTLPTGLTGSSITDSITITGAVAGTYAAGTIKVTASNACGSSAERTSASAVIIYDGLSVKDAHGNTYTAAQFGNAGVWMTQNLRTTTDANGKTLSLGFGSDKDSKFYNYPEGKEETFISHPEYGLLYTWAGATGRSAANADETNSPNQIRTQGICPDGWHLPSDYEWNQLEKVIAESALGVYSTTAATVFESSYSTTTGYRGAHGQKMESTTAVNNTGTGGTSNAYTAKGFDALLVGSIIDSKANGYSMSAYFWSSSSHNSSDAWYRGLNSSNHGTSRYNQPKNRMFSVRCKQN
jgi:uncharacterized protein (TIGR02145 family)